MELDAATLARAQAGDGAAQAELLRACSRRLRYLVARLGERGDADDLMQELYAKVLTALPRYRPDGPAAFGTWLMSVAHHWLLDTRRRKQLRVVSLEDAGQVADLGLRVDAQLEQAELRAQLERAVAQLSDAHRRVFVLACIQQQSLERIAAVEGVPLGTIKSRLHRARAELVLLLGPSLNPQEGASRAAAGRG